MQNLIQINLYFVPGPEVLVFMTSVIKPKAQHKMDEFYNEYKKQYQIGSYDKKYACIQIHKVLAHNAKCSPKQTKIALQCIVVYEKTTNTLVVFSELINQILTLNMAGKLLLMPSFTWSVKNSKEWSLFYGEALPTRRRD